MGEWKLYKPQYETDGSTIWYVDGEELDNIGYHFTYNLHRFYNWDEDKDAMVEAMQYDSALSILADYFEEKPTKEQLDKRECKCWKFHIEFFDEYLWQENIISSEEIKRWIDSKTKQYSQEDALIGMLKGLSLPLLIEKSNSDRGEYVWSFLDGKGKGDSFSDALRNALEYNIAKIRNNKLF